MYRKLVFSFVFLLCAAFVHAQDDLFYIVFTSYGIHSDSQSTTNEFVVAVSAQIEKQIDDIKTYMLLTPPGTDPVEQPNLYVETNTVDGNDTFLIQPGTSQIVAVSAFLDDLHGATFDVNDPLARDFGEAIAYYDIGRCDLAAPILAEMEVDSASQYLAYCQILAGDMEQAAETLTNFEGNPMVLAWIYTQLERPDDAINLMDAFVDNAEDVETQVEALSKRAEIQALAFNFDAAIEDVTTAIEIAEENDFSVEQLSELYQQRGDHIFLIYEWDRVLADYDRAIELDSTNADAIFARGVLYYTQGPRPMAQVDFEIFLQLAPDDRRASEAQDYIESITAELEALGGDDMGD